MAAIAAYHFKQSLTSDESSHDNDSMNSSNEESILSDDLYICGEEALMSMKTIDGKFLENVSISSITSSLSKAFVKTVILQDIAPNRTLTFIPLTSFLGIVLSNIHHLEDVEKKVMVTNFLSRTLTRAWAHYPPLHPRRKDSYTKDELGLSEDGQISRQASVRGILNLDSPRRSPSRPPMPALASSGPLEDIYFNDLNLVRSPTFRVSPRSMVSDETGSSGAGSPHESIGVRKGIAYSFDQASSLALAHVPVSFVQQTQEEDDRLDVADLSGGGARKARSKSLSSMDTRTTDSGAISGLSPARMSSLKASPISNMKRRNTSFGSSSCWAICVPDESESAAADEEASVESSADNQYQSTLEDEDEEQEVSQVTFEVADPCACSLPMPTFQLFLDQGPGRGVESRDQEELSLTLSVSPMSVIRDADYSAHFDFADLPLPSPKRDQLLHSLDGLGDEEDNDGRDLWISDDSEAPAGASPARRSRVYSS